MEVAIAHFELLFHQFKILFYSCMIGQLLTIFFTQNLYIIYRIIIFLFQFNTYQNLRDQILQSQLPFYVQKTIIHVQKNKFLDILGISDVNNCIEKSCELSKKIFELQFSKFKLIVGLLIELSFDILSYILL